MAIMEENSESSQQPKVENVKITIDDQFQSMKKKFSQYIVEDQKPTVACNYRVPNNLRKGHENMYIPIVVSIGPLHYGKPRLQAMERSKRMFLAWYMERSTALSLDDMVRVAIDIEEEARMSYLECFDNISRQEFSEMIVLDFVFLIELFFKFANQHTLPFGDSIVFDILCDTILLENQFQQHLATHLFHLLYKEHNLGDLIIKYFFNTGLAKSLNASPDDWNNATDMLDFLLKCDDGKTEGTIRSEIQGTWLQRACSATELREAGVKFSKVVDAAFLLDFTSKRHPIKYSLLPQITNKDESNEAFKVCRQKCKSSKSITTSTISRNIVFNTMVEFSMGQKESKKVLNYIRTIQEKWRD
ncbi:hypothetical protein LguiA_033104 [Lonicera macranthoides]